MPTEQLPLVMGGDGLLEKELNPLRLLPALDWLGLVTVQFPATGLLWIPVIIRHAIRIIERLQLRNYDNAYTRFQKHC